MRRISQHKDANHDVIVQAYRDLGFAVRSIASATGGTADLLVAYQCAHLTLVEVKQPKAKLKPKQEEFRKLFPVRVVRTVADAFEHSREVKGGPG